MDDMLTIFKELNKWQRAETELSTFFQHNAAKLQWSDEDNKQETVATGNGKQSKSKQSVPT